MKTALLVAHDPCLRRAVCDLITPGGVRIVCARLCDDALRDLDAGLRPRLVVLDLPRAGRGGPRFLRWLRSDAALRATPLLLLSDRPAGRRAHALVARYGAIGALPDRLEEWRVVQVVDRLCARERKATPSR